MARKRGNFAYEDRMAVRFLNEMESNLIDGVISGSKLELYYFVTSSPDTAEKIGCAKGRFAYCQASTLGCLKRLLDRRVTELNARVREGGFLYPGKFSFSIGEDHIILKFDWLEEPSEHL